MIPLLERGALPSRLLAQWYNVVETGLFACTTLLVFGMLWVMVKSE